MRGSVNLCNNRKKPLQLSHGNHPLRLTLTASSREEADMISGLVVFLCKQSFEHCKAIIIFVRMVIRTTNDEYDVMRLEDKQFYLHIISQYNQGSAIHYYYLITYY